ncbi:STAS domain-containing protein [Streptomyces sp. NBC_00932]|uniref:STAS domain-containing protein n=1 Tax=Streptomyces sp. NBC_00932 TaxID=2903690 RepID=UPI0038635279|nr:STAS domain-containing protein [Streptomyces sp. NBC_00932]
MRPLTVTTRDAATGPVLEISGHLDHATASEVREALANLTIAGGQLLVLDLARLDFCDSSGITVLLAARNIATEQGADIALAAVPANTARVLRTIGLDRVFTLYPDAVTATGPQLPGRAMSSMEGA